MSFRIRYILLLLYLTAAYRIIGFINHQEFQAQRSIIQKFESWIPFAPESLLIYFSYYILMLLPLIIFENEQKGRQLVRHLLTASLIAHVSFLIFPVSVERYASLDTRDFWQNGLQSLYNFDYNNNCLPTLHVVHSLIVSSYFYERFKSLWFPAWAIAISISTILVRQHHWIDIVAGVILVFAISLYFRIRASNVAVE